MTLRERYRRILLDKDPNVRTIKWEFGYWGATINHWYETGMPKKYPTLIESKVEGLEIKVYRIKNNFFGEKITVAGLLTGTDVEEQLRGQELGDALLIPAAMLRSEGDLFLDGKTPEGLSEALGVEVIAVDSRGDELISAILGI